MYCDIPEFGRCCLCLPLRRGILVFGYINVLYSSFMVGLYSYMVHNDHPMQSTLVYHGVSTELLAEMIVFIFCLDVLFNCLLVYGAHQKLPTFLKVFYYYTITTCVGAFVLQIVHCVGHYFGLHDLVLSFAGLMIQVYLLLLVRSLLRKLSIGDSQAFDNQLHAVVSGEAKNEIYNPNSTVCVDNP